MNTKKENVKDIVISICMFLSGFSCFAQLYYFQPLLPDLANEYQLTPGHSSLVVSFSTLGMVIGLFTAMFFADRIPRKKLIGLALLSSSVFSVLASFAPSFSVLIVLSMLKGFFLSGATSVSLAYISEEVSAGNKSRITGLYIAGNALGGMGGRVIASYLCAEYSWRIASASLGILCGGMAFLFILFTPVSLHFIPKKEYFKTLIMSNLKLIISKELLPFYLTGSFMIGIFVSLYNYLGFFLTEKPFNFPAYFIHYIYFMYLFGVFGSVATVKLTRYFNHFKVLIAMIAISSIGILLVYINNFWIVSLGLAIFTFSFFVVHVICNRVVSDFNSAKRTVTISIYLLAYYLGSSFWGSATGIVLDELGWEYFLLSLIILVLIVFFITNHGVKILRKNS